MLFYVKVGFVKTRNMRLKCCEMNKWANKFHYSIWRMLSNLLNQYLEHWKRICIYFKIKNETHETARFDVRIWCDSRWFGNLVHCIFFLENSWRFVFALMHSCVHSRTQHKITVNYGNLSILRILKCFPCHVVSCFVFVAAWLWAVADL